MAELSSPPPSPSGPPPFATDRSQLRAARAQLETAEVNLAAARERVKRITAARVDLRRTVNPDDPEHVARDSDLRQQEIQATAAQQQAASARAAARSAEAAATTAFAAHTDPRTGIAELDDAYPILLLPVRLETRFTQVEQDKATVDQLLVRVYPDECSVDTFDPVLSDAEVANARAYWIAIWQAGGHEAGERGAWRGLVGGHGSGRAAWIAREYQPVNLAAKPVRTSPDDVILTIGTDTAPPAGEMAALRMYWRAVWVADGAALGVDKARRVLVEAVGPARADELVSRYRPANLDAAPPSAVDRSQVTVLVELVVFPDPVTKRRSWARAPRVTTLPDRFVFIGYRAGEPPLVALGNPVPAALAVGPDPAAEPTAQFRPGPGGGIIVPDALGWLTDFGQAEAVGMGMRVPLTAAQAATGFDRVLVLGLRLNADVEDGRAELEDLLRHHWHTDGLGLVAQGTPTNNTETASGHDRGDDPDRSFDDLARPLFTSSTDWPDKRDGQWLAEYLGVDPDVFRHVRGAGGTDLAAARAMHTALWPATLGYWMQTLMAPVFNEEAIGHTRAFFRDHVLAGGTIPSLRLGAQPYGVLPVTAWSRLVWVDDSGGPAGLSRYLRRLYRLLRDIRDEWRTQLSGDVAFVGRPGDPHQTLLDVVGLHPGSVEWAQRYAESLTTLYNRLNLEGHGALHTDVATQLELTAARALLGRLGHPGAPQILERIFAARHNQLRGGAVADVPLSETAALRPTTTDGRNYLEWLVATARASLHALYIQDGFDGGPPGALLYLLLRHALQLGYHEAGVRLHVEAGLYTPTRAAQARADDPFLHIRSSATASESRYQPLFATAPAITGRPGRTVAEHIATLLGAPGPTAELNEQIAAVERLANEPTGRLERAFADHMDCLSYRLDPWLLGIVNHQLTEMRQLAPGLPLPARRGVYLGAYAWLEPLRPQARILTPVQLPPDLVADFGGPGEPPLMRDGGNEGYLHAPSLNHAVAAAVLRNGYLSAGHRPEDRDSMAVNLTSGRVRVALSILEGIRAGQSLSDLLGYRFERGLHDGHGLVEVDRFVYALRKAFPLRADRMASTRTAPGEPIEVIEARNVIDGLALVQRMAEPGSDSYPFGAAGLPAASPAQAAAINAEARRLRDAHDAIADLALAEGVYQAVLGNYDRVASTYDAYARGAFPPEPDIIRTPLAGVGLTGRLALHLDGSADPAASPIPGVPMTPRSQAEPAINAWLASVLPPLHEIGCTVTFREAGTGTTRTREVTLDQLGLQPADLVAIVRDDPAQAMTELDDRVLRHAFTEWSARPVPAPTIQYLDRPTAPVSVFEAMPLLRAARRLTTSSRPLRPTDLAPIGEARARHDSAPTVDKGRLVLVRIALQALRDDLAGRRDDLAGPWGVGPEGRGVGTALSDLPARRAELVDGVDEHLDAVTGVLARAAAFALPQSGWGFAYDFRQRAFAGLLASCADVVTRWTTRLAEFDATIARYDALPATTSTAHRIRVLRAAERAVSTTLLRPLPATPAAFRTHLVTVKRPALAARRDQFAAVAGTTRTGLAGLRADVTSLLPIAEFDPAELTLPDEEIVRFAQDALAVLDAVLTAADRGLAESQRLFDVHDAAASETARAEALAAAAKALLGEDFVVVPRFTLAPAAAEEYARAYELSSSGAIFAHLTNPSGPEAPLDFPVDTWLHGLARVREKVGLWERVGLLSEAFGRPEPGVSAMQLPAQPDEAWMGLRFPPGQARGADRLLYTAHLATAFDPAGPQCGLLLDEWTEHVPGDDVDSAVAFHVDRPNNEAPQAMLLVTPTAFNGSWDWADVVDALNETLDLAMLRAVEPAHIDRLAYATFLPATVMATQSRQLTISANLGVNNGLTFDPEA